MFFHQRMDHGTTDAPVLPGEKQCVFIPPGNGPAYRHIPRKRILAGLIEIDHTDLIAFAQHTQGIIVNIRDVQADQLRYPQTAVQKQRQNAVVTLTVGAIYALQQGKGLIQRQIAGEGLHLLGRIHVLAGVVFQKMPFIANIVKKRTNCSQFTGARSSVQTFVRNFTILVLYTITAKIGQIAVNIRQCDAGNEVNIHVTDVDLVQRFAGKRRITLLLQIAKEISHIQIVFIHGALRMRFDGFVVAEKIQQQLGRIGTVIHMYNALKNCGVAGIWVSILYKTVMRQLQIAGNGLYSLLRARSVQNGLTI